MWVLIYTLLSALSFFTVFWVIDASTSSTFLGDKETTRNLLTVPLIILGIVFLFQAGTTATQTFKRSSKRRAIDPMTPRTNARQSLDQEYVDAEFKFNIKQVFPMGVFVLILGLIFITASAAAAQLLVTQEEDTNVSLNSDTFDFQEGFALVEDPTGETNISLDFMSFDGFIRVSASSTVLEIKSVFSSASNPSVTDDSDSGYTVASRWINTTIDAEFVALDVTPGAAVWVETTAGAAGGSTINLEEEESSAATAVTVVDFGVGFDVSESPAGEGNVTFDITEVPLTDDNIWLGSSGTLAVATAIGDCDDSGGNHLNYDTTTNAFSCGTSGDGTGSTITTQEEDSTVDASTNTIDFGAGFDLTSAPAGETNVAFDITEISLTDDNVWVGAAGSTAVALAIGDCDDSGGSHLNYDTTTNAFSCGTTGDGNDKTINLEEGDVSAGTDVTIVDFGVGFDITESPAGEGNVVFDITEIALTDDNIWLGSSGTLAVATAIGDCDDSGGNHLNYDTTTNAFSCGTTGDGSGATIEVEEDNVSVDASVTNLDFGSGFDVTSSPAGEANVVFDITEVALTDDNVWVGSSGTLAVAIAIGDCDDSSGNHLNYDTTTNAFSCGTSSSVTDTNTHANAEEDNSVVVTDPTTFDFGDGLDVSADTGEADIVVDELEFNIAEDSLLVGAGTTSTEKVLTDCDTGGTSGVNYDTTANTFGCTTITGGDYLTVTASDFDVDVELYTDIKTFVMEDPTAADDGLLQHKFATAITITRISCDTDTGTTTIQFDERAEATPNSAGTDVMTSVLVCDTDNQATTSFDNAGIAADAPFNLDIDAVASTPGLVRIHVEFTFND